MGELRGPLRRAVELGCGASVRVERKKPPS